MGSGAPPAGPCPWLVYYHSEDYRHQTFCCNVTGYGSVKTYYREIKTLEDKEVLLSSSHGWLVLYDDKTKLLSLCNSATFDAAVTLPQLDKLSSPYNYRISSCVLLSSSPNSTLRDLQVVIFFESVSSMASLRLNEGGCQGWREVGYSHLENLIREEKNLIHEETQPIDEEVHTKNKKKVQDREETQPIHEETHKKKKKKKKKKKMKKKVQEETQSILEETQRKKGEKIQEEAQKPLFFSGAVSCGGKIFAKLELTGDYSIWSIEFVGKQEEQEEEVILYRLGEPHLCRGEVYLLESYGELFLVRVAHTELSVYQIETVEVYTLKPDESVVWERVKVVKDRAFFLGKRYCLSCPASEFGGRVYYCKGSERLCYRMEDDREIVFPELPDLPSPPPPPLISPIWIMPPPPLRPEDDDCTRDDKEEGSGSTRPIELLDEKSTSHDQDLKAGEKQLLDLPYDVLVQVSKHLVPFDYMNFRATSRICRSVIPPVKWINPLSGSETSLAVPFLMCVEFNYETDGCLYEFVDPRLDGKCNSYLMEIPKPIPDWNVIFYTDGAWVLTDMDGTIDLYNVFTGEVIPVCWLDWGYHSLFFTTTSGGEFVNVVICVFFWYEHISVSTVVPGEARWKVDEHVFVDFKSNKAFHEGQIAGPIFFEDAFCYLDCRGNLGKLEISLGNDGDYKASWEVFEMSLNSCDKCSKYFFLVERDGDLLSVFVGSVGKRVSVYRLNRTKMVWEIITSLGNYALYLSRASSISVKTSPDLGNRIYFPWRAVFYLETGEWHFSGRGFSCFDNVEKFRYRSGWITPPKYRIIRE